MSILIITNWITDGYASYLDAFVGDSLEILSCPSYTFLRSILRHICTGVILHLYLICLQFLFFPHTPPPGEMMFEMVPGGRFIVHL